LTGWSRLWYEREEAICDDRQPAGRTVSGMARTKGAKDKSPRKRKGASVARGAPTPAKLKEPPEGYGWLSDGHAAYEMAKELLLGFYKGDLTIGDARPMLRTGGKPVSWGCRLATVPRHLRDVQVDGPTKQALLIDKDWWESAGHVEQKGMLHACLARAAREKPVEVMESALRAHGAYTKPVGDIVEIGARQLTLALEEAEAEMLPPVVLDTDSGRDAEDAAERAREIDESQRTIEPSPLLAPVPETHVEDGYRESDFDEEGTLKTLAERVGVHEAEGSTVEAEEIPELESAVLAAIGIAPDDEELEQFAAEV